LGGWNNGCKVSESIVLLCSKRSAKSENKDDLPIAIFSLYNTGGRTQKNLERGLNTIGIIFTAVNTFYNRSVTKSVYQPGK
jgi:hypothetical protein